MLAYQHKRSSCRGILIQLLNRIGAFSMIENRNGLKNRTACFLAAAALAAVLFLQNTVCFAEGPGTALTVDIRLDGSVTNIANYTADELRSMPQTQTNYSSVTAYDAPSVVAAKGIALSGFFETLGVESADVSMIILSSSDGGLLRYSGEEYLNKPRYYYSGIFGGGEEKEEAAPMLALEKYEERQSAEPDLSRLSSAGGISFCFGQNEITDKVSIQYGKYINKITLVLSDGASFDFPPEPFGSGNPGGAGQVFPGEAGGEIPVSGAPGPESASGAPGQTPVAEEDIDRGLTADTLTVTVGYYGGPYEVKKVFTLEELYGMDLVEQAYTYIDNMPAVVLESARGVRFADLIKAAGIDVNSVESFHFYCSDVKNSWYQSINKDYLVDTIRYYYPKLQESWDYETGEAGPGAAEGAEEVETVIALEDNWLRFATEPDFENLVKKSRFRLVFGQTDTVTRNAYRSAKWIHTIEVMLGGKPPEPEAAAEPGPGEAAEPEADPGPELVGSEFRHDDTLGEEAGDSGAGVQNWRVYEMSQEAEELRAPSTDSPLLRVIALAAALVFASGTAYGIIRYYREV